MEIFLFYFKGNKNCRKNSESVGLAETQLFLFTPKIR